MSTKKESVDLLWFETEDEALLAAEEQSREKRGRLYTVIQSPHGSNPKPGHDFVVDGNGGMVRNWERFVAQYRNGKLVAL